ncbi:MAG: 16S rRNA (uracil(1498)-N(3))-methyltransferase [Porticoccaceae bacterium]
MATPRVFTDQALAAGAEIGLESGPSHHLLKVLRLKPGAGLNLFNGRGGSFAAVLAGQRGQQAQVAVGDFDPADRESPLAIELAIGVSRGERMDWVVQKAVELGVAAIRPLVTERTEVRLAGERRDKKLGHWRQIAIAACEQCGRNRLPNIHAPQPLADWLPAAGGLRLVLAPEATTALAGIEAPAPDAVTLLIGPEGGLSAAEIAAAIAAGFSAVGLGPRVLRTETAPLAALAICQARWGDFR